ncbi:MAG: citrate synthase family protein [Caldilineales bacterium]|nr:citrate synthase family protein [Caldilineales bacterium]MCW5859218.1 citrate synthase family protein [Caldilineales bacterium]
MTDPDRYLSAQEAAARLGIRLPTLYSYVSRGLIRSETADAATRRRRYHAADVEALRGRKQSLRNPLQVAQNALDYGLPVLDSAITSIHDGRLCYRGYDALALAQERTVEEVAALIWLDRFDDGGLFASQSERAEAMRVQARSEIGSHHPIERYQAVLARAGADDLLAHNTEPLALAATGARILQLLAAVTADRPVSLPLAGGLQTAWAPDHPAAAGLLSSALILCADHELNVSAFTARCVASAGSTPYAVVIAGLSALQGRRHGGHNVRVAALLRAAQDGVFDAVVGYLRAGDALPGFGHPLYPDGDPRARLLLDLAAAGCPDAPAVALAHSLCETVFETVGLRPTIDLALETTARSLGLPAPAALAIFALGRTIGWIGHAGEQYASGQLIRPRARYVGRAAPALA